MKVSKLKENLKKAEELKFQLPDGSYIPAHFHLTEIGVVTKTYIDCGNTLRNEKAASMQLWYSTDTDHRLSPEKLLKIIQGTENQLGLHDLETEVEYQGETIGRYGLDFDGKVFQLVPRHTECKAGASCGTTQQKPIVRVKSGEPEACCSGSGCC